MYGKDEEQDLIYLLKQVPDPRKRRGIRYKFSDLLLMCIYGILAGHGEASEIAYYTELNYDYFSGLLGIEHVPSHDTFSRILQLVDFTHLSGKLGEWLAKAFPEIYEKNMEKKVLHVDGKAVRAASRKSGGEEPIYHLNAMYEGESIGVKIKRVEEKKNEISSLPDFLKMFNLTETIVTIDAIGCNKKVIETIEERGGKYVLPVKKNRKKLLKTIEEEIERLGESGELENLEETEMIQKEHGRIETTQARLIKNTAFLYEKLGTGSFYGSIARIGIIDKKTEMMKDGKEVKSKNRTIIITDLEEITVENMLKIKQAHWNIEMQHWLLDIQLNEDRHTARKGNAVTNNAILKRFCLMVRKHDEELSSKPLSRFLMANEHDAKRIEGLLFGHIAQNTAEENTL